MSCVFNSTECNTRGEAGVPHPSKPDEIVYGLCTCPGVSYRYGVCTGIPEAYLPSFEEFYRNMTGESLTVKEDLLCQFTAQPPTPLDAPTPEELMEKALQSVVFNLENQCDGRSITSLLQSGRLGEVGLLKMVIDHMNEALKALQEMKDSLSEKD